MNDEQQKQVEKELEDVWQGISSVLNVFVHTQRKQPPKTNNCYWLEVDSRFQTATRHWYSNQLPEMVGQMLVAASICVRAIELEEGGKWLLDKWPSIKNDVFGLLLTGRVLGNKPNNELDTENELFKTTNILREVPGETYRVNNTKFWAYQALRAAVIIVMVNWPLIKLNEVFRTSVFGKINLFTGEANE